MSAKSEYITLAYANEFGAGKYYNDGSSIKWVKSLDITITCDALGNETRAFGRVGI
jgi:hypothetical protein